MKATILSIIIPHYNRWNELSRALETIPRDDDIQIIVVDDKSEESDKYWDDFIAKYSHVEFYKNSTNEKNAGVCRNIGLTKAKGEWLAFLDSDDYFLEAFKEAFEIIRNEKSADIVYFPPISVEEGTQNTSTRHKGYVSLANDYLNNVCERNEVKLKYNWTTPWSKFIRRSIVDEGKITFDSVTHGNDVMFSMKTAYAAKNIKVVPITFYCITVCKESLVGDNKHFNVRWLRIKIIHRKYSFLRKRLSAKQLKMAGFGFFKRIYTYLYHIFWLSGIKKSVLKKKDDFIKGISRKKLYE